MNICHTCHEMFANINKSTNDEWMTSSRALNDICQHFLTDTDRLIQNIINRFIDNERKTVSCSPTMNELMINASLSSNLSFAAVTKLVQLALILHDSHTTTFLKSVSCFKLTLSSHGFFAFQHRGFIFVKSCAVTALIMIKVFNNLRAWIIDCGVGTEWGCFIIMSRRWRFRGDSSF